MKRENKICTKCDAPHRGFGELCKWCEIKSHYDVVRYCVECNDEIPWITDAGRKKYPAEYMKTLFCSTSCKKKSQIVATQYFNRSKKKEKTQDGLPAIGKQSFTSSAKLKEVAEQLMKDGYRLPSSKKIKHKKGAVFFGLSWAVEYGVVLKKCLYYTNNAIVYRSYPIK